MKRTMEELDLTDTARARRVAASIGLQLDDKALAELWGSVQGAALTRDLNQAAAVKARGGIATAMASVTTRMNSALAILRNSEVSTRFASRIVGETSYDQILEGLEELAALARSERQRVEAADRDRSAEALDTAGFERPTERVYQDLASLARGLGSADEASVTAFIRAVFHEWGEALPTAAAIHTGIHRPGRSNA